MSNSDPTKMIGSGSLVMIFQVSIIWTTVSDWRHQSCEHQSDCDILAVDAFYLLPQTPRKSRPHRTGSQLTEMHTYQDQLRLVCTIFIIVPSSVIISSFFFQLIPLSWYQEAPVCAMNNRLKLTSNTSIASSRNRLQEEKRTETEGKQWKYTQAV